MKWHSFDIQRIVYLLLPVKLRQDALLSFCRSLLAPLESLIRNIRYKMQHDSRVIYLEKVLNESFLVSGYTAVAHQITKQIVIGPGEIPDEVYIFQDTEPDVPPYIYLTEESLGAVFMFTREELNSQYCDFTVLIPSNMQISENKLKSLVDYYKMAGKKYKIKYI